MIAIINYDYEYYEVPEVGKKVMCAKREEREEKRLLT
jgi:hypothetical protein